jgi:hypothetical protein
MVHRNTKNLAEGVWRAHDPPLVRPLGTRTPHAPLSRGASLIVILVLSLGLWVAIWEALSRAAALL